MSLSRVLVVVALLGVAEFELFEWRYRDLVYLDRPVSALASDSSGRFDAHADLALSRPSLTRATLETIAQASVARRDRDRAIRALGRLERQHPADAGVRLRLADALREAGRLDEARALYREVIAAVERSAR